MPGEVWNMFGLFASEAFHAPQRVWANFDAPWNIYAIVVTLDTSHLERSPLNDFAE